MLTSTIAFLGAGNMGEALIRGLLSSDAIAPEQLRASDRRPDRLDELAERYKIETSTDNREVIKGADVVVLAVKPQILDSVLAEIDQDMDPSTLVISIAAGVDIKHMEANLASGVRVIRTMPNVASLVAEGATAIAAGSHAREDDLVLAQRIFDSVGMTVVVEEALMDSVTGLSGSGPAYIFLVVEALSDAGVKVGLSRWDAQALAAQTVLGAAKLIIDTGEHPGRLKDMVCSPGGTAIAAVHTLEQGGLRTTLIDAVETATRRSRELGKDKKD
jgi:pyrroline-5-carboxylate reductase